MVTGAIRVDVLRCNVSTKKEEGTRIHLQEGDILENQLSDGKGDGRRPRNVAGGSRSYPISHNGAKDHMMRETTTSRTSLSTQVRTG